MGRARGTGGGRRPALIPLVLVPLVLVRLALGWLALGWLALRWLALRWLAGGRMAVLRVVGSALTALAAGSGLADRAS